MPNTALNTLKAVFWLRGHIQSCWPVTKPESGQFKLLRHPCWLLWCGYGSERLLLVYYFAKDWLVCITKANLSAITNKLHFFLQLPLFCSEMDDIYLCWPVLDCPTCLFLHVFVLLLRGFCASADWGRAECSPNSKPLYLLNFSLLYS